MPRRVVVIGAGPGGLASAMLLARGGVDVTLLERRGVVGGRTSAIEAEGFRFDMGPTFFLYPRVLSEVFEESGFDLHREVEMKRLDPQYHLVFEEGGELRATPDVERMQSEIARLCPRDADALVSFLNENRRKLAAFRPILESSFDGLPDVMKLPLVRLAPLVRPWESVDRNLRRFFSDRRVRLAFSFQSKYLGMSPMRCPGLFTILSFLEYEHGVYHPTGGCAAVSERMAALARGMGVDIRLNEAVTSLKFDGRRVVGAVTEQVEYPCDGLVINADFAHAMETLVPDHLRRRWTNRKISRKRFSCSTFMLYLGLDRRYDHLSHHTIYLTREYEQNLRDIERGHVLSDNPSFYVQNPGITDRSLAPDGMSTLYVLAPVTHQHPNVDWSRQAPAFRQTMMKQLAKLGLDDLEGAIRYEKMFTPDDWHQQMAIHRGATFNLAHSLDQMLHLRPRNRFEDLDGVYLVGGGTHPGSGLPVIYESARISSRLLLSDLGVRKNWPVSTSPEMPPVHGQLAGAM